MNLPCFQLYTSLLALVSVAAKPKWSRVIIRHLNTVLVATFCVYVYRDIYPLITYTSSPLDKHEGHLLWAKIGVLGLSVILVPLLIPRQYVPVDPNVSFLRIFLVIYVPSNCKYNI
jgi:hypothetical protein